MNVDDIKARIEADIASRGTGAFGIKVGERLFRELVRAGLIRKARFGVTGTQLFQTELPAYDGKYPVTLDWELDEDAFMVGQSN